MSLHLHDNEGHRLCRIAVIITIAIAIIIVIIEGLISVVVVVKYAIVIEGVVVVTVIVAVVSVVVALATHAGHTLAQGVHDVALETHTVRQCRFECGPLFLRHCSRRTRANTQDRRNNARTTDQNAGRAGATQTARRTGELVCVEVERPQLREVPKFDRDRSCEKWRISRDVRGRGVIRKRRDGGSVRALGSGCRRRGAAAAPRPPSSPRTVEVADAQVELPQARVRAPLAWDAAGEAASVEEQQLLERARQPSRQRARQRAVASTP